MRSIFQTQLVNEPFGDPGLHVSLRFERRALQFDLGELGALSSRQVLSISDVFISHTHIDHFIGFDAMVRICLGRPVTTRMYGPPGLIAQVAARLAGYTWNLVEGYEEGFTLEVTELHPGEVGRRAVLRCQTGFAPEDAREVALPGGVLLDEHQLRVRAALLDHKIPCLGFALDEKLHVGVNKDALAALGLPVGTWLRRLKRDVLRGAPDATPMTVRWQDDDGAPHARTLTIGELRERCLILRDGQRVAYVTDVLYSADNAARITDLVQGAALLYIEAPFLGEEAARAAARHHLTAPQAGALARRAGVERVEPFHFSPRHLDAADQLRAQVAAAFAGDLDPGPPR